MAYIITGSVSFLAGIVLTLIFRVRVENKLKAEKTALIAAAKAKL